MNTTPQAVSEAAISSQPGGLNLGRQFRFALRSLVRDFKAGELRVLALALLVAVASVTAVGFFTDRIGRAVERQAGDVLAADLIATSSFELPEELIDAIDNRSLDSAQHIRFPSVVVNERDESPYRPRQLHWRQVQRHRKQELSGSTDN